MVEEEEEEVRATACTRQLPPAPVQKGRAGETRLLA
jgi:hypothetical protein